MVLYVVVVDLCYGAQVFPSPMEAGTVPLLLDAPNSPPAPPPPRARPPWHLYRIVHIASVLLTFGDSMDEWAYELLNQSASHLDTIFSLFKPSLLGVQLTTHQCYLSWCEEPACFYCWNPGIRPFAILPQHLLQRCICEVPAGTGTAARCPGWAPAGLWETQPRGFVSCRQKCLCSVSANRKPDIPPTDLLGHWKGQQRIQVPHGTFLWVVCTPTAVVARAPLQSGKCHWTSRVLTAVAGTCLKWLQIKPFNVPSTPSYSCAWRRSLRARRHAAGLWDGGGGGGEYITLASTVEQAFRVWSCHHHFCLDSSKCLSFLVLHVFWI